MTPNEETGLVPASGGAMEVSPEIAAELDQLQQSAEELGGTLLDMLAIYAADHGRWKVGDTKKDTLTGIYLYGLPSMRTFWPPDAPMGSEPPTCWSLGGDNAVPSPKAIEAQHATCEGCPWDEFGTASKGKGKACKTKRADFFVELDPNKLEKDEAGNIVVTGDSVIGVALVRASATSRDTRQTIGQWAKDVRQLTGGTPQLVVTEWGFTPSHGGGVDFDAPTLSCLGKYTCDAAALREVVELSKDLREHQAEEVLTTLAGTSDSTDKE
jgi:hypothetical protein